MQCIISFFKQSLLLKVRSIDLSLEEKFFLDFIPESLINRTNNVQL